MSSSPEEEDNNLSIINIFIARFDHHHHEQLATLTLFANVSQVKEGLLPASKSSIESLPTVKVSQEEEEECGICMMGYVETGEAKEMPCKHKFHADCVNKWLGIRGSCPVCRFQMPVDEQEKTEGDEDEFVWQLAFLDMESHQELN